MFFGPYVRCVSTHVPKVGRNGVNDHGNQLLDSGEQLRRSRIASQCEAAWLRFERRPQRAECRCVWNQLFDSRL